MEIIKTVEEFNKLISKQERVVVDFYADWCPPCKMLEPVYKAASEKVKNVTFAKVNVDNLDELKEANKVSSIPTLILFENGKEIDRNVGFMPEDNLLEFVKK